MSSFTRSARMLVITALCLAVLAGGARAEDDEEVAESKAERPVRDMNATFASAVWTFVPIAAGFAIGLGNDGGGTTLASGTLVWGGALAGPAVGYWYGGAGDRAVPGLVVRGATFALVSLLAPTDDFESGTYPAFHDEDGDDDGKRAAWIAASAVILASGVYDIVRAEGIVDRAETSPLAIVPLLDFKRDRFGLAVAMGF